MNSAGVNRRQVARALQTAGFLSAGRSGERSGYTTRQSLLQEGVVLVGWRKTGLTDEAPAQAMKKLRGALESAGFEVEQADATSVLRVTGKRSGDAR